MNLERRFAEFMFNKFMKKHTVIEFKKERGGDIIKCQIRIYGWMVAEAPVLQRKDK